MDSSKRHPAQKPEAKSLREQIAASHLRIAGLGMACVTFALMGCLTLNIFLQQIADDSSNVNLATAGLQAGIQNSLVSLKTAAISGNPTFLEQHENAWVQFIHPNRDLLRHTVSQRFIELNGSAFRDKAEDITEDFLSGLHEFRSAQKDIETVLSGKTSDVEFRPATGSLVEEGNAILQSALLLTEEPITRKSEAGKSLERFVRFFHEAHTEALLFALGNETASPSHLKRKLVQAEESLGEAKTEWPGGNSEAHKEFSRLNTAFQAYRDGAIQSVVMHKGYTPSNAVYALLSNATKTATELQSQLEKIRIQHNRYADYSLRTLAIMTIVVLLISFASAGVMVFMAFRYARRQGRAIAGPVRHLIRAVDRFSRTQEVSRLPESSVNELRDLADRFSDMCFILLGEKHVMQKNQFQLEASNSARSQLLVAVSQQLRAPLEELSSSIARLGDTGLDAPQLAHTADIEDASNRLSDLLEHISLFSTLDTGDLHLAAEPFSVVAFVESITDYFRNAIERKGLTLSVFVDPLLPGSLLGDAKHIKLGLGEVIRNAIDHTETGGIALEFSGGRSENGFYTLDITVRDTGSGVHPHVSHLVRRTTEKTTTDSGTPPGSNNSLGLGLSIARRVAELHNGGLEIEGDETGTTCRISVELKTEGAGKLETFRQLDTGRVMLLHHQSLAAETMARQLEAWGLTVKPIRSLKAAHDHIRVLSIRNEELDWVIVDDAFTGGDLDKLESLVRTMKKDRGALDVILLSDVEKAEQPAPHPVFRLTKHVSRPVKERELFKALSTHAAALDLVSDISRGSSFVPKMPGASASGPLRLLVVDPDLSFQIVLSTFLRQLGHQVELVQSGEQSLSAADNAVFDAAFVSSEIHDANSVDLLRQIRKSQDSAGAIPVFALADTGAAADENVFTDAGFTGVIEKPIDFVAVSQILRKIEPTSEKPEQPMLSRLAI